VRGELQQPFIALAVVRALGEVQPGTRDRADLVEQRDQVGDAGKTMR
jgi:hypothetical protein